TIPNNNIADDIELNIKYFIPASNPISDFFKYDTNINKLNVCISIPKYNIINSPALIVIITPNVFIKYNNANSSGDPISFIFSSVNFIIIIVPIIISILKYVVYVVLF